MRVTSGRAFLGTEVIWIIMPRGVYPSERRRGLKKLGLRRCLFCKGIYTLSADNFFRNFTGKGSGGFGWNCKECNTIKNRSYYNCGNLKARFELLKKFNFTCQYCGRKAPDVQLHIDHITPVSKGGSLESSNLTVACSDCNIGKRDNLL